jgi:hypothetical protein
VESAALLLQQSGGIPLAALDDHRLGAVPSGRWRLCPSACRSERSCLCWTIGGVWRRSARSSDFTSHPVRRGNKGGPGNPFAASVAKLRQAALEIVTPQEIQGVFRVLLLRAQTGHLASIKLLLAYTIGLPAATVDPDEIEDLPALPPPPPVIEVEEDDDEEDFEEPQAEEENPGPAKVETILQALTAALNEAPQQVRDDLARRLHGETEIAPQAKTAVPDTAINPPAPKTGGAAVKPPPRSSNASADQRQPPGGASRQKPTMRANEPPAPPHGQKRTRPDQT